MCVCVCVCVWTRLCVSADGCVYASVPWQSHFMHHKQTDSVSEWRRWLASRLLREAFTNRMISSSQLWSSHWPMISIPPHLPSSKLLQSHRDHSACQFRSCLHGAMKTASEMEQPNFTQYLEIECWFLGNYTFWLCFKRHLAGSWTCFSVLKAFHLSSKRVLQF